MVIKASYVGASNVTITAAGGTGGDAPNSGGDGGAGGEGRVFVNAARIDGETMPAANWTTNSLKYASVMFGGVTGRVAVAYDSTHLAVMAPPHSVGWTDITIINPDGQTVTISNAFQYLPVISGLVTNTATRAGVNNALVTLSGGAGTAMTSNGVYHITVNYGWSGTATISIHPTNGTGAFTPVSRGYTNVINFSTNQNYSFVPSNPTITGRVVNADTGVGISGAKLTFSEMGGSVTSAVGGGYSRAVAYNWTGTVTPAYSNMYGKGTFTPSNREYASVTANQLGQDYSWKPPRVPGNKYVSLTGLNQYPYTNWTTAARDIQTAVNSAGDGDTIYVADGTYNIDEVIVVDKPVTIKGVNGAKWCTIRRTGGNCGIASLIATNALLEGFTIRAGNLTSLEHGGAGGVYLDNGAQIWNCIVTENTSTVSYCAGGITLRNGSAAINCAVLGNYGGPKVSNAGGVLLESGSRLVNCTVYGNYLLSISWVSPTVGCGGVWQATTGSTVYVENSIVWGNSYCGPPTFGGVAAPDLYSLGHMVVRHSCYSSQAFADIQDDCFMWDPGFADSDNGDYQLREDSYGVNAGEKELNATTNDVAGNPRVSRGQIDLGAYEYVNPRPRVMGWVTHEDTGEAVAGVSVAFSGGAGSADTDAKGFYCLVLTNGWNGTATPGVGSGVFTQPVSRAYANVTSDWRSQNFVWTPPPPMISGRITQQNTGEGVDGIVLNSSVQTTNGGYYSLTVSRKWTGEVVPFAETGEFSPQIRFYENLVLNQSTQDFTWIPPTRMVAGRVTHGYTGAGVEDVTVQFSNNGGSAVTASGGGYTNLVPLNWSGRATPVSALPGTFAQAYRDYANVTNARVGQDYVWTPADPTLSGRVTNTYTRENVGGALVTFPGWGSVTTAVNGTYAATVPWNWSGTVTVTQAQGGNFLPGALTNLHVQLSEGGLDFGWVPPVKTIGGRITHGDTGAGVNGVSLALEWGGSTTTTNGGYYTHSLYYGWRGTVTVALAGGTLTPNGRMYEVLTDSLAAENYVWNPSRTISGTVTNTDTGVPVSNVWVRYGTLTSNKTSAAGTFSLVVDHGSSDKLVPWRTNGNFTPGTNYPGAVTANVAGLDFGWNPPRLITGQVTNQDTGLGVDGVEISLEGGGRATTTNGGYYTLPALHGWSGQAVPSANGAGFIPPSRTYAAMEADVSGQNYSYKAPRTISGMVTNIYTGAGEDGVEIRWGRLGTNLTAYGGYYSMSVPDGWNGTCTVAKVGGALSPSQWVFSQVQADQGGVNFAWSPTLPMVLGRVTNHYTGAGVPGMVVAFSDGGAATTDVSGRFSRVVSYGWSGTISPSCSTGTMAPASRLLSQVTVNTATQTFEWTPPPVWMSGTVTNGDTGNGEEGVELEFSGGMGSAVSGPDGSYAQTLYLGWSGTVSVEKEGGMAVPSIRSYTNVSASMDPQDYVYWPNRTIAGRLTTPAGVGVSGVVLNAASGIATKSDSGGYYCLSVMHGWSGAVTPTDGGQLWTFGPASRSYENVTNDWLFQNYTVSNQLQIAGQVKDIYSGAGVDGVVVSNEASGNAVVTTNGGLYALAVPVGWSGRVSASCGRGSFQVAQRDYVALQTNAVGQNYLWLPPDPVISGQVTNLYSGAGIDEVQLTFSGAGETATANGGYYDREVPLDWSGTVTVFYAGGSISPSNRIYVSVRADTTNQNYAWVPPMAVVSGRVENAITGGGQGGVRITFSGGAGSATTDVNGVYAKALTNSWSGTVTPSLAGGRFNPTDRSMGPVDGAVGGIDFQYTPGNPGAGNRYVSPVGSSTFPYTNWAMASTNLQWAINAAQAGETVWVTNGTYTLSAAVNVAKGITLQSVNGAETAILRCPSMDAAGVVLSIGHANATVSGFTVRDAGATNGVAVDLQSGYLNNSIVRNNAGAGVNLGDAETARMANVLVLKNHGGVGGTGTVVNCTVVSNAAGGIRASVVFNTICDVGIEASDVKFCLAPGLTGGQGNESGDPLFEDALAGDYHLQKESPARDSGHDEYNTLTTDLDGNPRIMSAIDMGVYESAAGQGPYVSLRSEPNPVIGGNLLCYLVRVGNAGPGAAGGVRVAVPVPNGTTYASNSAGANYDAALGVWTVGALDVGDRSNLCLWVRTATGESRLTNVAHVTATQADAPEPGYDWATNLTDVLGPVKITNVLATTTGECVAVEWNSVVGQAYNVYSYDGELHTAPAWTQRQKMVTSAEIRNFLDEDAGGSQVTRRYYQVTFSDRTPTASNMWAVIRCDVAPGYTLISPPVVTDRRFDGEMGAALAEQLHGSAAGTGTDADEVYVLQPNGAWRVLYLDAAGTWRESDGSRSTYRLPAGMGMWVARKTGTDARITFTGPVGNAGTNAVALQPGFNLIGLSEGKDLPLEQTLAGAGPQAGATEETADQLVIQRADGTWRFLMYVTNWGVPYDGRWFDLGSYDVAPSNAMLEPGAAYYYLRRGATTELEF